MNTSISGFNSTRLSWGYPGTEDPETWLLKQCACLSNVLCQQVSIDIKHASYSLVQLVLYRQIAHIPLSILLNCTLTSSALGT